MVQNRAGAYPRRKEARTFGPRRERTGGIMTHRYIYAEDIGAGPDRPGSRWGLYSRELTVAEAAERYDSGSGDRDARFGVILLEDGHDRPRSYLELSPHARSVVLRRLNPHGSVAAAYAWGAAAAPDNAALFLDRLTWYAYPGGARFFCPGESVSRVCMSFRPDGYAKQDRVAVGMLGQAAVLGSNEYNGIDVSANWTDVPEFGEWDTLFHPDPVA